MSEKASPRLSTIAVKEREASRDQSVDGHRGSEVVQVGSQLQQEVTTLKAQVADQIGLADAIRSINNLSTAQVRKETPSLIDVKGLGRPKEFSGKEEDLQHRSK